MDGLDATGLSVANPAIARDLHASLPSLQAITTGYMVAMAASVIVVGKLGDRYGHRRVFLIGLAGFAVSSALVGLSSTATEMVLWRVAQGVSGAMLAANAVALLRHTFPPDRFKLAVGLFSGGLALASLGGPFLGGALVEYLSWRAIFFVNLPIAAVAGILAVLHAPRHTRADVGGRLDISGVVVLAVAVAALVSGVSRAGAYGWGGMYPIAAFVAAIVLLVGFVRIERSAADPVVPLDLFRSRQSCLALAVILAGGLTHFGSAYYFALYLQQFRGLSPLAAGASLLPMLGLVAFGGPLSGLLNQRYGPRLPVTAGLTLLAAGAVGLSVTGLDARLIALIPWLLPMGLGVGLALPTATAIVVSQAPAEHAGAASGLQHTVLMVSGALAVSVLGAIITASAPQYADIAVVQDPTAFLTGLRHAFLTGAALTATTATLYLCGTRPADTQRAT